jgi:HEPN domain-containing protein
MLDIQKQIDYWRKGAAEEWEFACELLTRGRTRHGLFFLHLTVEKIIKAHVCKKTGDIPPKIHALLRLAALTGLAVSQEDSDFLGELTLFNIEGRYPNFYGELPPDSDVQRIRRETERVYLWFLNQL